MPLTSFCPVGCGLVHRVSLLEEFGHFIKDQVEVNCKHNGGKKAKNLWDTYMAYGRDHGQDGWKHEDSGFMDQETAHMQATLTKWPHQD